jgi:hypothetical protein
MSNIDLGHLPSQQEEMWHSLFDLSERMLGKWTIVGGQMVYLHCVEREADMGRVTLDVDALLDVRTDSHMFSRADSVLRNQMGFDSSIGIGKVQHRWTKGPVQFDMLIPEVSRGIAKDARSSVGGLAVQSPGANQALIKSEPVMVTVGGRTGKVFRPNLQGAIISKAAAYSVPSDHLKVRHLRDIATLLGIMRPDDHLYDDLSPSDLRHLRKLLVQLSDEAPNNLDAKTVSRIKTFLDTAISERPMHLSTKLPTPKPAVNTSSSQTGKCGAKTANGGSCSNLRGSCPHHGR